MQILLDRRTPEQQAASSGSTDTCRCGQPL